MILSAFWKDSYDFCVKDALGGDKGGKSSQEDIVVVQESDNSSLAKEELMEVKLDGQTGDILRR